MSPNAEQMIADWEESIEQLKYILQKPVEEKIKLVHSGHMDQLLKMFIYVMEQELEIMKAGETPEESMEKTQSKEGREDGATGIQDPEGN